MTYKAINKEIFNGNNRTLRLKKWRMVFALIVLSLNIGSLIVQAQPGQGAGGPSNTALIRNRCEAKYPERFKRVKELEKETLELRERLFKAKQYYDKLLNQAKANEELAQHSEDAAREERRKGNIKTADAADDLAKSQRKTAKRLRDEAGVQEHQIQSIKRSISADEAFVQQKVQQLLQECGFNQAGNNPGGNQGGGENNNGSNQGGNGSGSGSGSNGNQGGGGNGGGTTGNNNSAPPAGNGNNNGNNQGGGNNNGVKAQPVDQTWDGKEPNRVELENGGYKELYANKKGQVYQEVEFDKHRLKTSTYTVQKVYPKGKPAEDSKIIYGNPADNYGLKINEGKYDTNGKRLETSEFTRFKDKTTENITIAFEKGTGFPLQQEVIRKDATGKEIRKEVYTDFTGKFGANQCVITENGETKTYIRDENGNWKLKEDKKEDKKEDPKVNAPTANQPQVDPPKPKDEPRGDMKCLAGTWRSTKLDNKWGKTGGLGITLVVDLSGNATVDFSQKVTIETTDPFSREVTETQVYSGKGNARIKADNNQVTVVSQGAPSISYKRSGKGKPVDTKLAGLGPLSNFTPIKFTCGEKTLTISTPVETFTFERNK